MSDYLFAIGAYDGRYHHKTKELAPIASLYAYTRNRLIIAIVHFEMLVYRLKLDDKIDLKKWQNELLSKFGSRNLINPNIVEMIERCNELEKTPNHDVVAIVDFLKEKYDELKIGPPEYKGLIYLGLTSQDLNTSANMMIVQDFNEIIYDNYVRISESINHLIQKSKKGYNYMLSLTHGQPATPTTLSWTMKVFMDRIKNMMKKFESHKLTTKFGGATGGMNAYHCLNRCDIDWDEYTDTLCYSIGLERKKHTTQVDSYDDLIIHLNLIKTYNNVLYDMAHDIWHYISRGIFKQKVITDEAGSSAMPHKVNPICFENAMGNISIANGLIDTFSSTLPISIMQRDLRDSTILRQLGNIFSGCLVAWKSLNDGFSRLAINEDVMKKEINENIVVVVEALQTILRVCGNHSAYNQFKTYSRGKEITSQLLIDFIDKMEPEKFNLEMMIHIMKINSIDELKTYMKFIIKNPETYFSNKPITSI
jgi:adenylosuccinate lyase